MPCWPGWRPATGGVPRRRHVGPALPPHQRLRRTPAPDGDEPRAERHRAPPSRRRLRDGPHRGARRQEPAADREHGRRLPPALVSTFTEPFQRGTERVRTDEHAGVGLGLAIVHSIVRAHAGTLDLVPDSHGGLLVTVRLPGTP
ncbi:ATP-binding protein [Micromonospora matsumotoense]|uniref:ATP-binding protein n=1 Tax=Micromonospora matsumotoense TaxID=121616 RepID=UPI003D8AE650